VHDGEKTNLLDRTLDPLGTKSRIKSQGGNFIEMDDDSERKHMVMANGNFNTVKSYGRPSYNNTSGPTAAPEPVAAPVPASGSRHAAGSSKAMSYDEFMASTGGPRGAVAMDAVQPPPSVAPLPPTMRATPGAVPGATAAPNATAAMEAWLEAAASAYAGSSLIAVSPTSGTPPLEVTFEVKAPNSGKEYRWTYQEGTTGAETEIGVMPSVSTVTSAPGVTPIVSREKVEDTSFTFLTEQNVYTVRCYERTIGTTVNGDRFGPEVKLRTDLLVSSDDPVVAEFYTSVIANYGARDAVPYAAATATTAEQEALLARPAKPLPFPTGYLNMAKWSASKPTELQFNKERIIADYKDLFRPVSLTEGVDYDSGSISKPPSDFKGKGMVTAGTDSKCAPPGLGELRNPDQLFANFTGSQGGEQVLTFGDTLELIYGNNWTRQYGHTYSWQSGDAHDYHPNGNTYTYFSGDSVTWLQGDNREWEYATNKKSFTYVENESSYSKVKTKSTSVSEVQESDSTETIYGVAKSTSNIGQKQDFEAVGASVTLATGGAQMEMSLNGPKVTIEGAISATITVAAAFELTTGYKCEVNLAAKHEFNPAGDLTLKTASQKATALADEAEALATTKTALGIENMLTSINKTSALLNKVELELVDAELKLSNAKITLTSGPVMFV